MSPESQQRQQALADCKKALKTAKGREEKAWLENQLILIAAGVYG